MRALALALVLLCACGVAAAQAPPEPKGYRLDEYRAPTPATLAGATVLGTAEAVALWKARGALFIDVLPHAPKPANLPAGTLWRDKPHDSIEGAAWLPEVGRGELAEATEAYYRASLDALTAGRRDQPLVIFCRRACWMSWNAAKRALSYGYSRILWYPDGVEGFAEAGVPLAPLSPYVLP